MSQQLIEIKYLHNEGEHAQRIGRSKLEILMKYRPIIELDSKTYEIEQFHYDPENDIFFVMLLDT
jgi:hypothetical protein